MQQQFAKDPSMGQPPPYAPPGTGPAPYQPASPAGLSFYAPPAPSQSGFNAAMCPPPPGYQQMPYASAPGYAQAPLIVQQGHSFVQQAPGVVVVTAPQSANFFQQGATEPVFAMCPNCRQQVFTNVRYEMGTCAWIWVAVIFFLICWPMAWLPCVCDDCKDAYHSCPRCGATVGVTYR